MKFVWTLPAVMVAVLLAACGGGGSSSSSNDSNTTISESPALSKGSCPHEQTSDVWLNNRLGCIAVGKKMLDASYAGASGSQHDMAFVIKQQAWDQKLSNILPGTQYRYYDRILCVKNVPASITAQFVAMDFGLAIGVYNFSPVLPSTVGTSTVEIGSGGTHPAQVQETCDPVKHPVIVDYATGNVDSVNADALASMLVYDL